MIKDIDEIDDIYFIYLTDDKVLMSKEELIGEYNCNKLLDYIDYDNILDWLNTMCFDKNSNVRLLKKVEVYW